MIVAAAMRFGLLLMAVPSGAPSASSPAPEQQAPYPNSGLASPGRSGLLGWGLALEAPVVGVAGGVASRSRLGGGYTLGLALSWELIPTTALRLWVSRMQTYAGAAPIRYSKPGHRFTTQQAADWRSLDAGLGAVYLWRDVVPGFVPYMGGGVAVGFAGYVYHFDAALEEDLEPPELGLDVTVPTHASVETVWSAGLCAGVRVELAPGLAGQLEISAFYVQLPPRPVSETLQLRHATAPDEEALLIRSAFSVWLGL